MFFSKLSALLLFSAVVFHGLDDKIANLMHQRNLFSKQIDSMSALISFGVAQSLLFIPPELSQYSRYHSSTFICCL